VSATRVKAPRERCRADISAGLEKKNGHLAEVVVDEVLRLVRNVRAEIAAHDAMPGGIVLLVEFLLDVTGDVFLDVVLLQRLRRAIHGILKGSFRKHAQPQTKKLCAYERKRVYEIGKSLRKMIFVFTSRPSASRAARRQVSAPFHAA